MPSLNANFDWVDTPNPTERAFAIVAQEGPADAVPDFLSAPVTWEDCPAWVRRAEAVPAALRGHTLVHCEKAGFQKRRFIFGRTRTEAERETAFKTEWVKRPHAWPLVLLKLWFEEGNLPLSALGGDGSIQTAARPHERSKYRRGGVYPTWFKVRHLLGERPYRKGRSITPITDSINYSFDGLTGSFQDCLHPGCRFPQYQTSGRVVFGAGTPGVEVGGDIVAQEFPPTNMTDWEKHVVEDTTMPVFGDRSTMYYRRVVEAIPPIDDRENMV